MVPRFYPARATQEGELVAKTGALTVVQRRATPKATLGSSLWRGPTKSEVRITLKKAYADGAIAVDRDPLSLLVGTGHRLAGGSSMRDGPRGGGACASSRIEATRLSPVRGPLARPGPASVGEPPGGPP
jgi:hypothetical protein